MLTVCLDARSMQTVSGKLARHVSKKRDKLLEGIDLVAGVEERVKTAFLTARSSRSTMRTAAEEVARNLRVAGHTRRKQVGQGRAGGAAKALTAPVGTSMGGGHATLGHAVHRAGCLCAALHAGVADAALQRLSATEPPCVLRACMHACCEAESTAHGTAINANKQAWGSMHAAPARPLTPCMPGCTQAYMEVMQLLVKVQSIRTLQRALKRPQETGDYIEALTLCLQAFQVSEEAGRARGMAAGPRPRSGQGALRFSERAQRLAKGTSRLAAVSRSV